MKAAWRRIVLLSGVSIAALAFSSRSSDDLVTFNELRRLRRAGAI